MDAPEKNLKYITYPSCTVAHNCHGKTKSHGTTNFTHGKTKLTHGKTKKTSWSAVGQRLLFASEMVGRVTVTVRHCSLEKTAEFAQSTLIRAHDVLHRVWFGSR